MLVTPDDLSKYMDFGGFDARQKVAVEFILEGVQSEIESYLRRPIEVRQFTESFFARPDYADYGGLFTEAYYGPVSFVDPGTYGLPLKQSPVVSVVSVYQSAVGSASAVPVAAVVDRDYVLRPYGIDLLYGLSTFQTVTVTYTAGLDGTQIPHFKLMILRAASREATNLMDDNKGIQGIEVRNNVPILPTGFTEQELKSIKRYKRQRI